MSMAAAASPASSPKLEGKEEEAYKYFLACLHGTVEEEPCKLRFLASICTLCRARRQGTYLLTYETTQKMVEKMQGLWPEEPLLSMGDMVRKQAILAITAMSDIQSTYDYLTPCISDTFCLPSQETGGQETELTAQIQQTLDSVLQMMVYEDSPETTLLTVEIILKALLPFLMSPEVDRRQRAVSTLVSLSRMLNPHSILKVLRRSKYFFFSSEKTLEVLAEMMAYFTLCCAEEDQEISSMAEEGLHIWLRFPMLRESRYVICMNPMTPVEMEMLCSFSPKAVNDDDTVMFGRFFLPAERSELLLALLNNIAQPLVSELWPVANMIEAVLRDPSSALSEVKETVRAIHRQMVANSHNLLLEDILRKTLLRLAHLHSQEVTVALLEASPHCDSSARALWRILASDPLIAEYAFKEMLQIQYHETTVINLSGASHCFPFLAISCALQEIFQVPLNCPCVQYFFGELFIAVVLQISIFLKCKQESCCPSHTARSKEKLSMASCVMRAVTTMQTLFCAVGGTSLVEDMWRQDAWPMLQSPDTFYTGIGMLTRALRSQGRKLCYCVFEQALVHLCREQNYQDMGVMAVFVELLDCIGSDPLDRHVLRVLKVQLQSQSLVLRRMTLSSLVRLSRRPKQHAAALGVLLTDVMEQLRVDDCNIKMVALTVLSNMLCLVDREMALPIALQLPEMLLPLFDNESSCMRERSILLYRDAMGLAVSTHRKQMKAAVRRSLVSLFFHLHDQEESVAQASREVLLVFSKFLKNKPLRKLLKTKQAWRVAECLLKDSSRREEYLEQSLPYLRSSQEQLRVEAIRFLRLVSWQLTAGQQEKLQTIYEALEDMQSDSNPTVSSLATETLLIQRGSRGRAPSRLPWSRMRHWLLRTRRRMDPA